MALAMNIVRRCVFRNVLLNANGRGVVICRNIRPMSSIEDPKSKKPIADAHQDPKKIFGSHYVPTNYEKKLLVWTKRYKSMEEVPQFVPQDVMERARNLFRVYGMIGMMILTFLGCVVMIESGKRAHERGESVTQMNIEWHKRQREADNDKNNKK